MTRRPLILLLAALAVPTLTLFCVDETQVALVTALGPTGPVVRTLPYSRSPIVATPITG